MILKEWLKSAAVAVGGGALAALSAAMMDPTKFNLANGLRDECLIALQGGLVGLGALFIRSPLGSGLIKALQDAKKQHAEDKALLDHTKTDVTGSLPPPPPIFKDSEPQPPK